MAIWMGQNSATKQTYLTPDSEYDNLHTMDEAKSYIAGQGITLSPDFFGAGLPLGIIYADTELKMWGEAGVPTISAVNAAFADLVTLDTGMKANKAEADVNKLAVQAVVAKVNNLPTHTTTGIHVESTGNDAVDNVESIVFDNAVITDDGQKQVTITLTPKFGLLDDKTSVAESVNSLKFIGATVDSDPNDDSKGIVTITPQTNSGTGAAVKVTDGTTTIDAPKQLNFENSQISGDSDEANIKVLTNWKSPEGAQFDAKANSVSVKSPLRIFDDPNGTDQVVLEIKRATFESKKPEGYLAYLRYPENLVGFHQAVDGYKKGFLWFDDVVVDSENFIQIDRTNKSYGIQEDDELDPNITGGVDFLVVARVALLGKATSTGSLRIVLVDKMTGTYIKDIDGRNLFVQKNITDGEDLGVFQIVAVINATGLKEMKVQFEHNFQTDLIAGDRTQGGSGIMIQTIHKDSKTGPALLQFENDTWQNIEFTSHYLGEYLVSLAPDLLDDQVSKNLAVGGGTKAMTGWSFYNTTPLTVAINDKQIKVANTGQTLGYFSFGKTLTSEQSKELRGKKVKVSVTLANPHCAVIARLAYWNGTPDNPSPHIISEVNSAPVPEANWTLSPDTLFIPESGSTVTKEQEFTVSSAAANNLAIILYPEESLNPLVVNISDLRLDVVTPTTYYTINAPEQAGEIFLENDPHSKRLVQDNEYFYSLRYTLNVTPTPMPVGAPTKGKADITLDPNINKVIGSSATGGEGAIVFNKSGEATILTKLLLSSESQAGTSSVVKFWYSSVSPDGTFVKLPDSETTITVKAEYKSVEFLMNRFTIVVNAGDKIVLTAQADILDGAFLISDSKTKPLISTDITFYEVLTNPGYGDTTDLVSSPLDKKLVVDRRVYNFSGVSSPNITIGLDIPDGVELANHSVVFKEGNKVMSLDSAEFAYDVSTKRLTVHIGSHTDGKVYLEFWG